MAKPLLERCVDCGEEYALTGTERLEARVCPPCRARETAEFARGQDVWIAPRFFARAALQERLGVTGREDV